MTWSAPKKNPPKPSPPRPGRCPRPGFGAGERHYPRILGDPPPKREWGDTCVISGRFSSRLGMGMWNKVRDGGVCWVWVWRSRPTGYRLHPGRRRVVQGGRMQVGSRRNPPPEPGSASHPRIPNATRRIWGGSGAGRTRSDPKKTTRGDLVELKDAFVGKPPQD